MGKVGQTTFIGLILVLAITAAVSPVFAGTVDSQTLLERTMEYDGEAVIYVGEVIGDIMRRGEYVWLNVSDGNGAIGVWLPAAMAEPVKLAGEFGSKGDYVEVSGVFLRACPEHGGDIDIHASQLTVLQPGFTTTAEVRSDYALGAVVSVIAALALFFLAKKKTRSSR